MMAKTLINSLRSDSLPFQIFVALALGSLLPLAFAPYDFWPLAIIIPVFFIWKIDKVSSLKRVFWLAWTFGLGYFGFGVYWIYNSLHDFGMAPPPVAAAITALLIAVLASFPAATMLGYRYVSRQIGARAIWLLPLLWFSFEWFRGWVLTGLPWLSIGYAHIDSPLSGYASVIGVYGVGAASLYLSVALLRVIRNRSYVCLLPVLIIPIVGYFLGQIEWTRALPQGIKVTMVQGNIPQELKWRYEERNNIINAYWRESSRHFDSDLIVWPETALPGQESQIDASILQPIERVLANQSVQLLTGIVVDDKVTGNVYNSMMLLGLARQYYHKRHLVIFGEYYPLRWLLDSLRNWINIPYSDLTAGPDEQPIMTVGDTVLGVSICFEDVFSRDILLALPAANLLVNASNDAWFGDSSAPHQHLQMAQMRSLETQRPMARSTNTGVSAFIDHEGRILEQTDQFRAQSITRTIQGREGLTPFYYFAQIQPWLALAFIAFILSAAFRRGRNEAI
ncbi:MAG: apolipoprotein N-acyltransferase [Planctomycetota bacterium]|jgi:apolipoprotein N-acyltransferase